MNKNAKRFIKMSLKHEAFGKSSQMYGKKNASKCIDNGNVFMKLVTDSFRKTLGIK